MVAKHKALYKKIAQSVSRENITVLRMIAVWIII